MMAPMDGVQQSFPSSSPVMKYMEVIGSPADPRHDEMLSIINSVSSLVLRSQNNQKLVQELKELETCCHHLLDFSPHYDANSETPGNGVRSFVKLVRGFLKQLEQKSSRPGYFSDAKKHSSILKSVSLVNTLIQLLYLIEEKRVSVNSSPDLSSAEIVNQPNWSIDEKISTTLLSLDRESAHAFLSMKPFWLSPSVWFMDELYARLIALRVRPLYKFLSVLCPRKVVEGNVDFTLNGDVNDLRNTWSFYGWSVMRPYVTMSTFFKPKVRKVIRIPRQQTFLIEGKAIKMHGSPDQSRTGGRNSGSGKVSCLFLHDNKFGHSPSDSLVIHLHGGGFCTVRPKAHEIYLRRWASRLRGVPILSIDYSLSPENRYPVALQEILDVYLFLNGIDSDSVMGHKETETSTRKGEEIISLIGFKPKTIVLCGDSAGSNLSVALMHVLKSLNELLLNNSNNNDRRSGGDCLKIPYPRSVCLQYPYMSPTVTRFTPSRLLMAFDPILPLGAMFSLSEAYHPQSKAHQDDQDSHPWFRKPDCSQRLRQIQDTDLGAFFNPLCGTFDDFRDIPLFIQVGEFDPLLDEAISLAKKWKGKVKLDIVDGLTHGYLFNAVLSSACQKAVDLSNDRLILALFGRS